MFGSFRQGVLSHLQREQRNLDGGRRIANPVKQAHKDMLRSFKPKSHKIMSFAFYLIQLNLNLKILSSVHKQKTSKSMHEKELTNNRVCCCRKICRNRIHNIRRNPQKLPSSTDRCCSWDLRLCVCPFDGIYWMWGTKYHLLQTYSSLESLLFFIS